MIDLDRLHRPHYGRCSGKTFAVCVQVLQRADFTTESAVVWVRDKARITPFWRTLRTVASELGFALTYDGPTSMYVWGDAGPMLVTITNYRRPHGLHPEDVFFDVD